MQTEIRIPYSKDQADAQIDSAIYGMPYGYICGEHEYIKAEVLKLGYTEYKVIELDDHNWQHVVLVNGS